MHATSAYFKKFVRRAYAVAMHYCNYYCMQLYAVAENIVAIAYIVSHSVAALSF